MFKTLANSYLYKAIEIVTPYITPSWVNVKRTAALAVSTFASLAELVLMNYFFPKSDEVQDNSNGSKAAVVVASFLLPSVAFALRLTAMKYFNESLKCNIKRDTIDSVLSEDKFLIHCAQIQSDENQDNRKAHAVVIGQKVDDFVDNFTPILSQFGNAVEIIGCGIFVARKTGLFPTLLLSGFTGGTLFLVHYITKGINNHSENERILRDNIVERFAFIENNASAVNIAGSERHEARLLRDQIESYEDQIGFASSLQMVSVSTQAFLINIASCFFELALPRGYSMVGQLLLKILQFQFLEMDLKLE